MKMNLIFLLLVAGLPGMSMLHSQNVFRLEKENSTTAEENGTVVTQNFSNGRPIWDLPLEEQRLEISGDRPAYRLWLRTRDQASYNLVEMNGGMRYVPEEPSNGMHDLMQRYLMEIPTTGFDAPATWKLVLPGFRWPRFVQEYYLADLVQARCDQEKPRECVDGYVRLKVLVDANGKVLEHEVLQSKNEWLGNVVAEELYKINYRPAEMLDGSAPPARLYSFLDFEFSSESCP